MSMAVVLCSGWAAHGTLRCRHIPAASRHRYGPRRSAMCARTFAPSAAAPRGKKETYVRAKAFSSFPLQTPAPCLADVAGCRRMNGKVVRSIFERAPMAVVGPNAARRPYQSAIRPQVRPESWGEDAEPSPSPMPSRARARARGLARGRGRARGRARAAWWRWW